MIESQNLPKLAMVFGVFDGLHQGHKNFLEQAAARCQKLIVVVAPLKVVQDLKNRRPAKNIEERIGAVQQYNQQFLVVAGDEAASDWQVLQKHKPEVIFLGYDQQGLAVELKNIGKLFEFLEAHKPEQYKSSLLNNAS